MSGGGREGADFCRLWADGSGSVGYAGARVEDGGFGMWPELRGNVIEGGGRAGEAKGLGRRQCA
jgi:hypothetical protein